MDSAAEAVRVALTRLLIGVARIAVGGAHRVLSGVVNGEFSATTSTLLDRVDLAREALK